MKGRGGVVGRKDDSLRTHTEELVFISEGHKTRVCKEGAL